VLNLILWLVLAGVWVYAIVDIIQTPRDEVRVMPKLLWIVVVVVFPILLGSVFWFVFGRPRSIIGLGRGPSARRDHPSFGGRGGSGAEYRSTGGGRSGLPSRTRSRRGQSGPVGPDDDPEFLQQLAERLRRGDHPDGPTRS
jgi:hypothetical protein